MMKKSTQFLKLTEQQTVYLNRIMQMRDFKRQLMNKWICRFKNCSNKDNYCFSDSQNSFIHYFILAVQQKIWATAISAEECTLLQSLIKLWYFWKENQDSIIREFRIFSQKSFQQSTKTFLKKLQKQLEYIRIQRQFLAEQNWLTQQMKWNEKWQ